MYDVPTSQAVIQIIRELASEGDIPRDLEAVPISEETKMVSLGLDSLGIMLVLSALDERYKTYIPDGALTADTTIKSIVDLLASGKKS